MKNSDIKDSLFILLDGGYKPEEIEQVLEEIKKERQNKKLINARYEVAAALLDYIDIVAPDAVDDAEGFVSEFVKELEKAEAFSKSCKTLKSTPKNKSEEEKVKDLIHKLGLV